MRHSAAPSIDWAWAAGLFEGEGSMCLDRKWIVLTLAMTDEETVRHFHSIVGVGKVWGPYRNKSSKRDVWRWRAGGDAARNIIGVFGDMLSVRRRERFRELEARVGR